MTVILGIETSCDETAAAIVVDGRDVRSSIIASQHDLHARYGGVVPEIASRAHLEKIGPVVTEALQVAAITFEQIDAIAVGNRPGLIGSLLVGVSAAKAVAWATGKPLIGVDHVCAHLYGATMQLGPRHGDHGGAVATDDVPEPRRTDSQSLFPALGLVVSGGHTNLYDMTSPTRLELLGRTIDDAVGEAYDKAAVILGLGYPGGPHLDRAARDGDPTHHRFPRAMLGHDNLDFSFSGLKTALLYTVRGTPRGRGNQMRFSRSADDLSPQQRCDLAASFQEAAVDALTAKLQRGLDAMAVRGRAPQTRQIGGGVSANSLLRRRVEELGMQRKIEVCLPPMKLCVDNAAMIAGLAFEYLSQDRLDDLHLAAMARGASRSTLGDHPNNK